ncbi:MAG: glycosyltransferase [Hyphomonas sp.]
MPATSFPVRPNLALLEHVSVSPAAATLATPQLRPPRRRLALVGGYAPRRCGIATFTTDIADTLKAFQPGLGLDIYVIDNPAHSMRYENVNGVIRADDPSSYSAAAAQLNESGVDAVWIQHEFGIFGGDCGEMICDFADQIAAPLIFTFHTVLAEPSPAQRRILLHLIARATRIMVMSKHARELLARVYGARMAVVDVIEHGAPDRPFGRQTAFKKRLGLEGRTVLMTFGLLGPGKGLEHAIEALPGIVRDHPDVVYRIVGATHPNLVAREGETYRERLMALATRLKVEDHIQWDNRFLDLPDLLDQLEACDIYLTPYPNLQQSTSGTLSYAVALGKAVVSTPYVHARELLADGAGVLIEPGSPAAVTGGVNRLLDQREALGEMQARAYARGRATVWARFADATAAMVSRAVTPVPVIRDALRAPDLAAMFAMSDDTGMLQHAVGVVPDRSHGYCVDDNARALMVSTRASRHDPAAARARRIYAAFVQDAWNEDTKRFRNFMSFSRQWLETEGSEDSNGRALWSLGWTVRTCQEQELRTWAEGLYDRTAGHLISLDSPRARAFVMLAAIENLAARPGHRVSLELVEAGAQRLFQLSENATRDWHWFEPVLAYDNARLCQALIEAGRILGRRSYLEKGLETLSWLSARQRSANGLFRPVGSDSFGREQEQQPFDQQPLEAWATIDAAAAAFRATRNPAWIADAQTAWKWFLGENDRGAVIADIDTGRCWDGLTPRGINRNSGAESILAFQLAYYSMNAFASQSSRRDTGA